METTAPARDVASSPPTFHRIFRSRWHRWRRLSTTAAKRFHYIAKKLYAEEWEEARHESRQMIRIGEGALDDIARQFGDATQGDRGRAGALEHAEAAICVAMMGYRAGAVVALSARPRRVGYGLTEIELAQVDTWLAEQQAALVRAHAAIHGALAGGVPEAVTMASNLARTVGVATVLPAIDAERALYAELRRGRTRAAETMLAASELRRRAIWTIGLALVARRWSIEPARLRQESLAAQKRAFALNIPNYPDRTLTSIERAAPAGPYEVAGYVTKVAFVKAPEQVSILTIASSLADTGRTIDIHTKRVRLTNIGVCRQAYVRVGVTIDPDDRKYWLDQLPVSRLAVTSWSSYAIDAVRPFYDLYPHSFNLRFTGTPEKKSALGANSIRRGGREFMNQPPAWLKQGMGGTR